MGVVSVDAHGRDTRPFALTHSATRLLRLESHDDVRRRVCQLAGNVLPADGYAFWALDAESSLWTVTYSCGLDASFVAQRVRDEDAPFPPLAAAAVRVDGRAECAAVYRVAGIQAFVSMPLVMGDSERGAFAAYYRRPHVTTDAELETAGVLGALAAAALQAADASVREAQLRAEAERQSRRTAFLAELATLFGSQSVEASFRRLAELAVPSLGDWCAIDVEAGPLLRRVAAAHVDPAKLALAQQIQDRYPTASTAPRGAARVLRTGVAELHAIVGDDQLEDAGPHPEHRAMLRALEGRSAIMVPLAARGRIMGVLTLVSTTPGRYTESDLGFLEELAGRAALAIDNARLFEEGQRANGAKDEFLALLSHELRTPLNAIMGWARLLLNTRAVTSTDAQLRQGLEIIQRNARLQAELVDGLLDVTRAASGGLPLSRQLVDAGDAAASAIEAIRPAAGERRLHVDLRIEDGDLHVMADPGRFQQILGNLLSNSVKFTEPGGRIGLAVRRRDCCCEIEVADTGAGIEAQFLPHVFERFRQADSSMSRRHGGLGLGLWLVQELVRAHGGTVGVASGGHGAGSVFTVRLPLRD